MTNEWYDINYVGFERIFVTGYREDTIVEIELNEAQKNKLVDFLEEQRDNQFNFLKELVNES